MKFIRIKNLFNLNNLKKCNNPSNLRKLGIITGFSNIFICFLFYIWLFIFINKEKTTTVNTGLTNLLITSIILHNFFNFLLINWISKYETTKWMKWVYLSLIFVTPLGLGLIFSLNNEHNKSKTKEKKKTTSAFHSFTNSVINLDHILNKSINNLKTNHQKGFETIKKLYEIEDDEELHQLHNHIKHTIIAIDEALKQTKRKNTFDDVVFFPNWYDEKFFDFAVINHKYKANPTVKYKFSIAFLIIDEFNNYKKIIEHKKEIKRNIKFGPAKSICLHWGKGFKVYINE